MKVFKKTVLSKDASAKRGNQNDSVTNQSATIKLKSISEADRQRLRIPSYQYILP